MPLHPSALWPNAEVQFSAFPSRRSVVHSSKGIVASTQPLASACGLEILNKGGNCADAAVAVAAGLNMTEPSSTGIGGDMFCLFYDAKTKKVHSLNGSGRAGAHCTLKNVRASLGLKDGQEGKIPLDSVHAATVPGAAAGWVDTVEKFGSGKVTLSDILAPAIRLGEDGFPVSEFAATFWANAEKLLKGDGRNGTEMLKTYRDKDNNVKYRAPGPGELMKNPTLANTFRLLATKGKQGFYDGEVAAALIDVVKSFGGHLTLDDLKHHMETGTEATDPIKLNFDARKVAKSPPKHMDDESYAGVDVWEHPPNGQGIVALMALGIIQKLAAHPDHPQRFGPEDHNSAEYLHVVIEALRIAFADAVWHVADPNVEKVPTKGMLDPAYLAKRAEKFSPDTAAKNLQAGSPSCDTVYFAVTDSEGNGISFINSNYAGFGTCIVPKGCGFTLQNRGANFMLQPSDHPNRLAPRKRPYHTIIPALVTNTSDQSLHSVYGVMGGFMQPQGHVQVLLNQLVFGLDPQAALDAPRICIGSGMPEKGDVLGRTISVEEGISEETVEKLRQKGHDIEICKGMSRSTFGRGQVIRWHVDSVDKVGMWSAGSDQRGDGAAVPQI